MNNPYVNNQDHYSFIIGSNIVTSKKSKLTRIKIKLFSHIIIVF